MKKKKMFKSCEKIPVFSSTNRKRHGKTGKEFSQ